MVRSPRACSRMVGSLVGCAGRTSRCTEVPGLCVCARALRLLLRAGSQSARRGFRRVGVDPTHLDKAAAADAFFAATAVMVDAVPQMHDMTPERVQAAVVAGAALLRAPLDTEAAMSELQAACGGAREGDAWDAAVVVALASFQLLQAAVKKHTPVRADRGLALAQGRHSPSDASTPPP